MGIRVLSGRGFVESDGAGAPRVMLINEALARRDFANRNPIGETVFISYFQEPWQIIGVIADVRQFGLSSSRRRSSSWTCASGRISMRWSFRLAPITPCARVAMPSRLFRAVRAIVEQMDAQASLFYVAPMEQVVASTISRPRLYATLLGIFSIVGLGLAVIGIYGVMSLLRRAADARDWDSRRARREAGTGGCTRAGTERRADSRRNRAGALRCRDAVSLPRRFAVRRHAARPGDVRPAQRRSLRWSRSSRPTDRCAERPASIHWWPYARSERSVGLARWRSRALEVPDTAGSKEQDPAYELPDATICSSTAQRLPAQSRRAANSIARWSRISRCSKTSTSSGSDP